MKPLSQKEKDALTIRKQKSECKICNKRGFIIVKVENETKAKPCECSRIKKPEATPVLPYKDDVTEHALNNF